ncbi:N-gene1 [Hyposoter didymator ichnovirus]|nr:N-gene1 [Hyposoter didymator ichnovirus]
MSDFNTKDESDCALDLSLKRPDSLTEVTCPLTMLDPTKTSANKNIPAAGTSNSGDKEQDVIGDTPATKAIILLPKKRPYGPLQIEPEEKHITPIMEIVEKQTKEVKEVTASSQTKPLRNRSVVTDKESQEPGLAASDKPNVKPARETRKKQSQKASTSQPSTSQPSTSQPSTSQPSTSQASTSQPSTSQPSTSQASTSQPSTSQPSTSQASTSKASTRKASTSKASTTKASISETTSEASSSSDNFEIWKEAGSNLKSGNKPSASKSVASSSTKNRIDDDQFWVETVMSKFRSNDYKNLLRESSFTESQAEALQNLFYRSCRKFYNVSANSNRVMKMHKCQDCLFSIRHQCVSINFLHPGLVNLEPTTFIAPKTIVICLCQFAIFHDHITRPSCSKTDTVGPKLTPDPLGEKRVTRLRCDLCDTILIIEHSLDGNTDCTLTRWSGVNSSNEKMFNAHLLDYLKQFTTRTLSLKELYTCNYNCCLFFHRCNE